MQFHFLSLEFLYIFFCFMMIHSLLMKVSFVCLFLSKKRFRNRSVALLKWNNAFCFRKLFHLVACSLLFCFVKSSFHFPFFFNLSVIHHIHIYQLQVVILIFDNFFFLSLFLVNLLWLVVCVLQIQLQNEKKNQNWFSSYLFSNRSKI